MPNYNSAQIEGQNPLPNPNKIQNSPHSHLSTQNLLFQARSRTNAAGKDVPGDSPVPTSSQDIFASTPATNHLSVSSAKDLFRGPTISRCTWRGTECNSTSVWCNPVWIKSCWHLCTGSACANWGTYYLSTWLAALEYSFVLLYKCEVVDMFLSTTYL